MDPLTFSTSDHRRSGHAARLSQCLRIWSVLEGGCRVWSHGFILCQWPPAADPALCGGISSVSGNAVRTCVATTYRRHRLRAGRQIGHGERVQRPVPLPGARKSHSYAIFTILATSMRLSGDLLRPASHGSRAGTVRRMGQLSVPLSRELLDRHHTEFRPRNRARGAISVITSLFSIYACASIRSASLIREIILVPTP